eukprot:SAG25_NODE_8024_length_444_cov_1.002899_1_plen_100_part_10
MFHASRMLLVTRGLDAKTDDQCFSLFAKHFVTGGLVESKFEGLVKAAEKQDEDYLLAHEALVLTLADAVNDLYKNMDDSLRFKVLKASIKHNKLDINIIQ